MCWGKVISRSAAFRASHWCSTSGPDSVPRAAPKMPDMQKFYEENKDRVNLLGIDVGQFTGLGDQASAKALLEELDVTYPAGFTNYGGVMRDY